MRRLLPALFAAVLLTAMLPSAATAAERTISFSGYTWSVKTSGSGTVGPGGNYFSDSTNNVRVDSAGLHMAIVNTNGRWTCAEVGNTRHLGYGTYRWELTGDVTTFAPQVVLGLFTWSDQTAYAFRELDIEYSKWADAQVTKTGWFTVQTDPNHYKNFLLPSAPSSVQSFTWTPTAVHFAATANGQRFAWSWKPSAGHAVPVPGDEVPRINLWLSQHKAPTTGTRTITVKSFRFSPL